MLDMQSWFIREHVGMLKLTDTYDILDPDTNEQVGIAKENPGGLMTVLRLAVNKQMLPTRVDIYEGAVAEGRPAFSIKRGFTLLRSKIDILSPEGEVLGWFKSKMFSLGGAFRVFDAQGNEVALVQGNWKGWDFKFLDGSGNELGCVTKKWSGIGKELFTSADNYIISLNTEPDEAMATLLLAAGLAIDVIYGEGG
ncbi:MAG: oxidoreductase [Planctomycetes bacterium]|nr:oxidoreductase [Planctomycetota bacterium]